VPSIAFEKNLDATLSKLAAPGRTIVMFELPLLPHRIAYGTDSEASGIEIRCLANSEKRYFTTVIGGANGTSDGLHLSNLGTYRMATLVATVLSPALRYDSKEQAR
jgi:hypothetical protein